MFGEMFANLWKRSRQRLDDPLAVAVVEAIRGSCPVCGKIDANHSYAPVAAIVLDDAPDRVQAFFRGLDTEDWNSLRDFRQFDVDHDTAEAYAIGCPAGRAVVVLRMPHEFWESPALVACATLKKSSHILDSMVNATWRPLTPPAATPAKAAAKAAL
jgi:hypothetical protein